MNKLLRKYKLYILFMLMGIALLAILPTSCSCNCTSNEIPASIAFIQNGQLCVINPNDTTPEKITDINPNYILGQPVWSPDGKKIFVDALPFYTLYVIDTDGSNQIVLTNDYDASWGWQTAWSPDSSKLVFISGRDGNAEIYTINADGTEQTNITNNAATDLWPAWSPDGKKIAYISQITDGESIYVMDADGSNQTLIVWGQSYYAADLA